MVVEQPLDGNYTDGGKEASSDLEHSSGSFLPDDQACFPLILETSQIFLYS